LRCRTGAASTASRHVHALRTAASNYRSVRVQTFIKTINYSHMMPTRYNLADVDLKSTITSEVNENSEAKKTANKVRAWHASADVASSDCVSTWTGSSCSATKQRPSAALRIAHHLRRDAGGQEGARREVQDRQEQVVLHQATLLAGCKAGVARGPTLAT
jgi:Ribosomal L27e protein family